MLRVIRKYAMLILLIIFTNCAQKGDERKAVVEDFDSDKFTEMFNNFISNLDSTVLSHPFMKSNIDSLIHFYSLNGNNTVIVKDFESLKTINSILDIFSRAKDHGLDPELYKYSKIKSYVDSASNRALDESSRYKLLCNTEILLADAIIKYSKHMRNGVVNPRKLYTESYFLPVTDSLNKKLLEPLFQKDVVKYLKDIQPKSKKYKKLQAKLKFYESIKDSTWPVIPLPNPKIVIGNHYSELDILSSRLSILGFLDTSFIKINKNFIYDSSLSVSVRAFQIANGFKGDGIIDKSTIERLNIKPKEYIEKIKINLERFRWVDYSDTSKYVLVNIPDFHVRVFENDSEKFSSKVCTGKKITWQTPILLSQITHLVLNPTWTVPRSIIKEEIANGLRKDSLYLKKRNFRVYKSGQRVSLDGLSSREVSSGSYTIIQDPGAGNALGKIKFMFNNPFGVYLHDTPTRAPFNYVNRAVSHGCVRVEKPYLLADYLITNNSSWTIDYLKIEVGQKVENQLIISDYNSKRSELRKNSSYGVTTELRLDKPVPVIIDYYTTWADDKDQINYREDVYNNDKVLFDSIQQFLSK